MSSLPESQRWCVAVMKREAKSFFFSTRILPRAKREAVEALYGLCRFADDTADEPGLQSAQRLAAFETLLAEIRLLREPQAHCEAPWFPALARAFERFPIDLADVEALVLGCRSDVEGAQIATMDDLERYAAAVAGTVGRCSLAILGANDPDSLARGERLGIAMQLTNVLRDVEEDRTLGRNYLPLQAFAGTPVREVMRAVALRARCLYRESDVLASRVPNDGSRVSLMMTSDVYEGILDRLEARGFDPSAGRVYVTTLGKFRRAARSAFAAYAGLPTMR